MTSKEDGNESQTPGALVLEDCLVGEEEDPEALSDVDMRSARGARGPRQPKLHRHARTWRGRSSAGRGTNEGRAAPKEDSVAKSFALSRVLGNFSTLSMRSSKDPVCSVAWEFHGRLVTFKWKQTLLQVRAWAAIGPRWRRNPRWLAAMSGKEMGSLWGILGAASHHLQGPKGPQLLIAWSVWWPGPRKQGGPQQAVAGPHWQGDPRH